MNILVFNSGSSTLKFQLIEAGGAERQRKLAHGLVDRIGGNGGYRFAAGDAAPDEKPLAVADHEQAVQLVMEWLQSNSRTGRPEAVGHRIVHGGLKFTASVLIDGTVTSDLEALSELESGIANVA